MRIKLYGNAFKGKLKINMKYKDKKKIENKSLSPKGKILILKK